MYDFIKRRDLVVYFSGIPSQFYCRKSDGSYNYPATSFWIVSTSFCLYGEQLSLQIYISDEGILGAWLKKAGVNDGFLEFPVRSCDIHAQMWTQHKIFDTVHVQDNPWTWFIFHYGLK